METFVAVIRKFRYVVFLPLGAAALATALTYFLTFDARNGVGYAPQQPLPFSHTIHAGKLKLDCRFCHVNVERSRHATVPSTNICMKCHAMIKTDSPHIQKLTEFHNSGKSIPWKRVHKVPDYAFFDHSVHVTKGIDCMVCHGNVKEMDRIRQNEPFNMLSCLNCHRSSHEHLPEVENIGKGPTNCSACHR